MILRGWMCVGWAGSLGGGESGRTEELLEVSSAQPMLCSEKCEQRSREERKDGRWLSVTRAGSVVRIAEQLCRRRRTKKMEAQAQVTRVNNRKEERFCSAGTVMITQPIWLDFHAKSLRHINVETDGIIWQQHTSSLTQSPRSREVLSQ